MKAPPSLAEAGRLIRAGQLHPEELVRHCLGRIQQFEDRVHAWVRVDEEGARREAERLGGLLREGRILGPLHGIPVGVKDIVDVQGMPTEAGSPLLKGRPAERDAPLVARLRAAGAVILGKTVTTEFAFIDPPPTRNPWNLEHTPGGSSSGSAAAVAMEMCLGAVGSQTGGSITRPASYCGVAGLKPTFGRVETTGVVPVSERLDHVGPIARTVADLSILFAAMTAEADPDEWFAPPVSPPELAVIEDFFMEQADESVRQASRAAFDSLRAAGARLSTLTLPASFASVHLLHRCIMAVDAAEVHFATYSQRREAYGPKITELIEQGLGTLAIDYVLSLRHQQQFRRDLEMVFREGVIAVTPSTVTAAPAGLGSTGDPQFNSPWSYAGLPTATVPCGLTPDGLPCGLQLIAPANQERQLLAVAAWCERVLAFHARPPLLGEN
jgi:aspartyl-tRNA(Asn)/glutamyl-tRNA(Gln) amidotransferase subunit A